jgi:predicted nucleotidyltransferase
MAVLDTLIAAKAIEAVRVIARWGRVRAAYLFGSHTQATADEWSDIDIAVFVEGAENWDFERLSRACAAAQRKAGLDIEMHVFPASSHENPPRASFAQYIIKHGERLDIGDICTLPER